MKWIKCSDEQTRPLALFFSKQGAVKTARGKGRCRAQLQPQHWSKGGCEVGLGYVESSSRPWPVEETLSPEEKEAMLRNR